MTVFSCQQLRINYERATLAADFYDPKALTFVRQFIVLRLHFSHFRVGLLDKFTSPIERNWL